MPALTFLTTSETEFGKPAGPKFHSSGTRRVVSGLCIRVSVLMLAAILAGGCRSMTADQPTNAAQQTAQARLMSRFNIPWQKSTYMIATVQTPEELWNVYVVSIPPNQVAIRQSRQDGEYEFGFVNDIVWHVAFGKGEPTRLGEEWAWFIKNHEIFRFSEWLGTLDFSDVKPDSEDPACTAVRALDAFSLAVTLCIDDRGDPIWIERETPAAYGTIPLRIEIAEWSEYEGRRIMKKFRQVQRGRVFEWEIQGLLDVPDGQQVRPPENLNRP